MSDAEAFVRQIQELERQNIFSEQRLQQESDRHQNTIQALNKGKKQYSSLESRYQEQSQEVQRVKLLLESANTRIDNISREKEELTQHSHMLKSKYSEEEERLRKERKSLSQRLLEFTEQVREYRSHFEGKPEVEEKRRLQAELQSTEEKLQKVEESLETATKATESSRDRMSELEAELSKVQSERDGLIADLKLKGASEGGVNGPSMSTSSTKTKPSSTGTDVSVVVGAGAKSKDVEMQDDGEGESESEGEITDSERKESRELVEQELQTLQTKLEQQDEYIEWMLSTFYKAVSGQCCHCDKICPLGSELIAMLEQEQRTSNPPGTSDQMNDKER